MDYGVQIHINKNIDKELVVREDTMVSSLIIYILYYYEFKKVRGGYHVKT